MKNHQNRFHDWCLWQIYGRHGRTYGLLSASSENSDRVLRNMENTSARATLTTGLWEMVKLPTFVQMHYSHNTVSIYKRQMFVMHTSFFLKETMWSFHTAQFFCGSSSLGGTQQVFMYTFSVICVITSGWGGDTIIIRT